jgi:hypothetical protein
LTILLNKYNFSNNLIKGSDMTDYAHEVLKISRLLTPEHQAELLGYVRLAQRAEDSARKSLPSAQAAGSGTAFLPAYSGSVLE